MMPNARCPLPLSNSKSHNAYLVRSDVTLSPKNTAVIVRLHVNKHPSQPLPLFSLLHGFDFD